MIRCSVLSLLGGAISLAGCADDALRADTTESSDSGDVGSFDDTAVQDGDTGPPSDPSWYVVRADLTIAGGVGTAEAADVDLEVVDADLVRTNCEVALDTSGLAGTSVDGAEPGSVWWELPVVPTSASCATLPGMLSLGVGSLHPDVRARLGAVGHDDIADSLFGAWLVVDGELTAYGYAGTATDLVGDDDAALPPPDGLYRLAPLYLVPLPE